MPQGNGVVFQRSSVWPGASVAATANHESTQITPFAYLGVFTYIDDIKSGSTEMKHSIPASEFTRNFGRYQMLAQREPVAVTSHGRTTGYFIAAEDYEAFKRFKESRRSFASVELPEE